MNLRQEALSYLQSEHHFIEQEFINMFSVNDLESLYKDEKYIEKVKQNVDYFLEDNYYGPMRRNWFKRIQSQGEANSTIENLYNIKDDTF